MDIVLLTLVFLASTAVSACAVLLFSRLIERVFYRLLNEDLAAAWSVYSRFALFVAALVSGLRLEQIEAVVAPGAGARAPITAGKCLLEVVRAMAGALSGAAWALLVIFGVALAVSWGKTAYGALRPSSRQPRSDDRRPAELAGKT